MEDDEVTNIQFEIHGDYMGQPEEFQKDFLERLEKAGRNVRYHGPYDNRRVDQLMRGFDVILVPSIWWENSPVRDSGSLRIRRPIVCSQHRRHGREVRDGKDGFHFPVGSAIELAALLRDLANDREQLARVSREMRPMDPPERAVDSHAALYGVALGAGRGGGVSVRRRTVTGRAMISFCTSLAPS